MATLDESVEAVNEFRKNLNEAAETNDNVKDGISTPEEEKQEPEFMMYDVIAETTIEILQNEHIVKMFDELKEKIGDDLTKSIIEAMSIAMTNSAFNAIQWYDKMLETNIVPQFNAMVNRINEIGADVSGYGEAIKALRAKVSVLEKDSQMKNIGN